MVLAEPVRPRTDLIEAKSRRTQKQVLDDIDRQSRRALNGMLVSDVQALLRMYDEALATIEAEIRLAWIELEDAQRRHGRTAFIHWKIEREAAVMQQIKARLVSLQTAWTTALRDGMLTGYEQQALWDAYGLDMATPPKITVNTRTLTPTAADAVVNTPWKGAMFSDRVWAISDDMFGEIQNQLGQSTLLGEGIDDAVRRIKNLQIADGNVPPRYAIERLARTEILRASDRSRELLYAENSDIVTTEVIVVAIDERNKENDGCPELEGLALGGKEARGVIREWDYDARPPFHPNCRCTTAPQVRSWKDLLGIDADGLEEFEDGERMVRDPITGKSKMIPVESFDAWKRKHGYGGR